MVYNGGPARNRKKIFFIGLHIYSVNFFREEKILKLLYLFELHLQTNLKISPDRKLVIKAKQQLILGRERYPTILKQDCMWVRDSPSLFDNLTILFVIFLVFQIRLH